MICRYININININMYINIYIFIIYGTSTAKTKSLGPASRPKTEAKTRWHTQNKPTTPRKNPGRVSKRTALSRNSVLPKNQRISKSSPQNQRTHLETNI